jgi:hypothetical protein
LFVSLADAPNIARCPTYQAQEAKGYQGKRGQYFGSGQKLLRECNGGRDEADAQQHDQGENDSLLHDTGSSCVICSYIVPWTIDPGQHQDSLGLFALRVAEHTFILDLFDASGLVYLAHPRQGVASLTVIGLKVVGGVAQDALAGGSVVILGEGVLVLSRLSTPRVTEQAQIVVPSLMGLWIRLHCPGCVAHQTVRPAVQRVRDRPWRHTGRLVTGQAACVVAATVDGDGEFGDFALSVAA